MKRRRLTLFALLLQRVGAGGGDSSPGEPHSTLISQLSRGATIDPLSHSPATDWQQERDQAGLHRSLIDRDPFYEEPTTGFDGIGDGAPIDSLGRRAVEGQEWRSPLEKLAPLPSMAATSHTAYTPFLSLAEPTTISNDPRHSHEVDIFKQRQRLQHSQAPDGQQLKTRSTGTTITALLAENNTVLILAADTRATDGSIVADKQCEKLHSLARNVWCAGAGTSADVDAMVRHVKFRFWNRRLDDYQSGNIPYVLDSTISKEDRDVPFASVTAILHYLRSKLQQSRGALGVNLLVGGYDFSSQQALLAAVHPHGSIDVVTYAALGSGGLAATGVLESQYPIIGNGRCTVAQGIRLAVEAVKAGIENDLGSGSQVDVCVISREGVLYRRAVLEEESLPWKSARETSQPVTSKGGGNGVNGFGNVKFAIKSKRVISEGFSIYEKRKREWLDEVLHL